jgi:hypothetical protein
LKAFKLFTENVGDEEFTERIYRQQSYREIENLNGIWYAQVPNENDDVVVVDIVVLVSQKKEI